MKKNKVTFRVTLELPPDATIRMARRYVVEAVTSWAGSLQPYSFENDVLSGDPMYDLDSRTVIVTRPQH